MGELHGDDPASSTGTGNRDDLGGFRAYLRFLAERTLGRAMSRRADPSDIVQETLLAACRKNGQLRAKTRREVAAWLRAILRNRIRNALRDNRRGRRDLRRERALDVP